MKRLLTLFGLVAAFAALSGCYYDPGYSYVRSSGSGGDAYYGQGSSTYYARPAYGGGYYDNYYGGGYYGGYGPGVSIGISNGWSGRGYYRTGRGYYGGHGGHYRGNSHRRPGGHHGRPGNHGGSHHSRPPSSGNHGRPPSSGSHGRPPSSGSHGPRRAPPKDHNHDKRRNRR